MKKYMLRFIMSVLCLSIFCSCASTNNTDPESGDSSETTDSPVTAAPGTLGEPLSQDGVVQDFEEGTEVEVSFSGKNVAAYYYDPVDSNEFIVFITPGPNDKLFRNYATIYKPDFNGVNGFVSALSDGAFQAAYVRKIIFAADEANLCVNSVILHPDMCIDGEIITGDGSSSFAGEGQEQYYCSLYDDAGTADESAKEKGCLISLPDGRCATVFGSKVAGENSGLQIKAAERNFKNLFDRYGINGIFK